MIFKVIGVILCTCAISVLLKSYSKEYGILVPLCCSAVVLVFLSSYISQAIDYVKALAQTYNIPADDLGVLIKCLGLSFISKIASDICLDCNEKALSSKIEICSKFALILTAIPIFKSVLDCITAFI